jgi:prepilin-type N-terminal cleavage/methylation domain-containing protein
MQYKNMSKQKGFTMIEMMVALLIIAILVAFVFVQMNGAANAGKDAQRKADVNLLANAVVSYSSEHYSKKPISAANCTIGGTCPSAITDSLKTYLSTLPNDPNSGTYYTYQSDGSSCTVSATLSNGTVYQYSCNDEQSTIGTSTNGVCGSSNNQGFYIQPTTNLCSDGFTPTVSGTGPWTWKCPGTYLGGDADCIANLTIDGVCNVNTDGYNYTVSIPPTNLCSAGTATTLNQGIPTTPTNYWSWSCAGLNGGTSPSCVANLTATGTCGTANNQNFYTLTNTSPNLCSAGTLFNNTVNGSVPNAGYWKWQCAGSYGGASSPDCSANRSVTGVCGSSGPYFIALSSGVCSVGTVTIGSFTGTGPWTWKCDGLYGGDQSGICTGSYKDCVAAGGSYSATACGSSGPCCVFSGVDHCPYGWSQLDNWSTTTPSGEFSSCVDRYYSSEGGTYLCGMICANSCDSVGGHSWSNVAQEYCVQNNCGNITWGSIFMNIYHYAPITQIGCH